MTETTEPKKEKNPIKAIRKKCYNCSGWNWKEVDLCVHTDCDLFEFRFGKNPYRKKRELTDEQKQKQLENLEKARTEKQEKRGETRLSE